MLQVRQTTRSSFGRVVVIALISAFPACGQRDATQIYLENESLVELKDIVLSGSDFRLSHPSLAARSGIRLEAVVMGESSITVSFKANDRAFTFPEQGYFEGGGVMSLGSLCMPTFQSLSNLGWPSNNGMKPTAAGRVGCCRLWRLWAAAA